jgi:hypothetical protein
VSLAAARRRRARFAAARPRARFAVQPWLVVLGGYLAAWAVLAFAVARWP